MKQITVMVPTYNEEENILSVYERTKKVFEEKLQDYGRRILFVDNCSTDSSEQIIRELCAKDPGVSAIFNTKNFGFARSQFNGLREAPGDAVVMVYADCQDPPEVIPEFIKKWEGGAKVVVGIKKTAKENHLMYLIRGVYYNLIKKISDIEHINQYNGFGLYDSSFIKVLRKIDDSLPYLRGIVAEYGEDRAEVEYDQDVRKRGKSSFNLLRLYDFAMLGITSSSKFFMHLCTLLGMSMSFICIIIVLWTLIKKLVFWNEFDIGIAAILVGVFFLGSVQLFFIGIVGEYIANISERAKHHPLVIEKERINLGDRELWPEGRIWRLDGIDFVPKLNP